MLFCTTGNGSRRRGIVRDGDERSIQAEVDNVDSGCVPTEQAKLRGAQLLAAGIRCRFLVDS